MPRLCEVCLRRLEPGQTCPEHLYADALDPDHPADAELIATRRELARPKRQALWVGLYAALGWLLSFFAATPLVGGWAWLGGGEAPVGLAVQGATVLWVLLMAVSALVWSVSTAVKEKALRQVGEGEAVADGEVEGEGEAVAGEAVAGEAVAGEDGADEARARARRHAQAAKRRQ